LKGVLSLEDELLQSRSLQRECRTVYVSARKKKKGNSLVHDFIVMFFCYLLFKRILNTRAVCLRQTQHVCVPSFIPPLVSKSDAPCICHARTSLSSVRVGIRICVKVWVETCV